MYRQTTVQQIKSNRLANLHVLIPWVDGEMMQTQKLNPAPCCEATAPTTAPPCPAPFSHHQMFLDLTVSYDKHNFIKPN